MVQTLHTTDQVISGAAHFTPPHYKRERLKQKFMNKQKAVGIEVFKAKIEIPCQVWSSCGYCNVPLCKKGSCFKDWHAQK
jgi:hypothetical protein